MRVAVLPADTSGCGMYRLCWPATFIQQVRPDWHITVHQPNSVHIATGPDGGATAVKGLPDPRTLDLIVIQRVGRQGPLAFLHWAQRQGVAVVVDADDAMWCIDRDNMAWKAWNSDGNHNGMHWRWADKAAEAADLTTVTTDALARRYGKHGRVEVLPNRIHPEVLDCSSIRDQWDDTPAVGWSGFVRTHPKDLDVVGDAVRRALAETGAVCRVIADGPGAERAWGLPEGSVEQLGPYQLGPEFFAAMTAIDIGLVPLDGTLFNRAKSSLKALEFSAMGVPVIATPTPANRHLGRDIPMLYASTPGEWYEQIMRLLRDPAERLERGQAARNAVLEGWTFDSWAETWAQSWERAVARRNRLTPKPQNSIASAAL